MNACSRAALILLLITCFLGLASAPAHAEPFGPDEHRAVELAHDHWHSGPSCPQGITYVLAERAEIAGSGRWRWPACILSVASDMPFLGMCTAVAHEWGHALQGARLRSLPNGGHSGGPGDLMSTSPEATPECLREDDRRVARRLRAEHRARRARCSHKPAQSKRRACLLRARVRYRRAVRDFL